MATQKQIEDHYAKWCDCTRCSIGHLSKYKVLHRGSHRPKVLFIGEAPGVSEDALGLPFVPGAPAGRILQALLDQTIELEKYKKINPPSAKLTYAITNVVACAPWKNTEEIPGFPTPFWRKRDAKTRAPDKTEQSNCEERLVELYNILNPKAVIYLGKTAVHCSARSQFIGPKHPVYQLELPHPSYMLRTGGVTSIDFKRSVLVLTAFLDNLLATGVKANADKQRTN